MRIRCASQLRRLRQEGKVRSLEDNTGTRVYRVKVGLRPVETTMWSWIGQERIRELLSDGHRIYIPD